MKPLLAALLLLFQLQPLLGSAVCLAGSERSARPQCEMPEHGPIPTSTAAQAESPVPNCPLASVCAPSQLAIAGLPELLQAVMDPRTEPSAAAATPLFSISSAPPFRPPRA